MKVMKKIFEVVILYLVFGIRVSFIVSFIGGGAVNLLVKGTMGAVSTGEYLALMGYVALLWLPILVFIIFSDLSYLNTPYMKIIPIFIIILFFVLLAFTLFSKRKNN